MKIVIDSLLVLKKRGRGAPRKKTRLKPFICLCGIKYSRSKDLYKHIEQSNSQFCYQNKTD